MNISDALAELYELEREQRSHSTMSTGKLQAQYNRRCYALNVAIGYIEAVTDLPSNVNKKVALPCDPPSSSNADIIKEKQAQSPDQSPPDYAYKGNTDYDI